VRTTCDHCAHPFDLPLVGDQRQIFQLHGEPADDDEELVVLDPRAHSIGLTHYIYECLRLALPVRHVHPEGQCDPEVDALLARHAPTPEHAPDPRWSALNTLKHKRP
ncbi:MAG: YceD family protein, partial [Flavobacteriales bacterium]